MARWRATQVWKSGREWQRRIWMEEIMLLRRKERFVTQRPQRPEHGGHGEKKMRMAGLKPDAYKEEMRGEISFGGRTREAGFGLLPEGFHLRARSVGEGGAALGGDALHFAEAAGEFGVGLFHGNFGIDLEEASEIDGDEKDIAD